MIDELDLPASPAEAYQTYFGPAIFEPLSAAVLAIAAPEAGADVLDIACGTGILTRRLARAAGRDGSVLGVDLNPAMVAVARSTPSDGASVEYREGDGTALELPDGGFDAVYCQQGLQFFPDRAAGVGEMGRVLVDGGTAVVATWRGIDDHPLYAALADAEQPHLAALGVGMTRAELAAPFSLGDPEELARLFEGAGFTEVALHEHTVEARFADADHFVERMEHAYAAVVPQFSQDADAFRSYLEVVAAATRDIVAMHRQGDHVVVPMHALVTVAR